MIKLKNAQIKEKKIYNGKMVSKKIVKINIFKKKNFFSKIYLIFSF